MSIKDGLSKIHAVILSFYRVEWCLLYEGTSRGDYR